MAAPKRGLFEGPSAGPGAHTGWVLSPMVTMNVTLFALTGHRFQHCNASVDNGSPQSLGQNKMQASLHVNWAKKYLLLTLEQVRGSDDSNGVCCMARLPGGHAEGKRDGDRCPVLRICRHLVALSAKCQKQRAPQYCEKQTSTHEHLCCPQGL